MQQGNTPQYWENLAPIWRSDLDDRLTCCHIVDETPDVKSFFFRPSNPGLCRFQPGQFITLELPINGETIYRSYTISSAPTRPDVLSITVKRKPDGVVSNWLHDNLQVGSHICVSGPMGDFSCSQHPAERYLLLSGGVGITPVMSMARALHDLGERQDTVFLHSARTPTDIVFQRELELMAFNQPSFRPIFLCENGAVHSDMPSGRLTLEILQQVAPDLLTREVFCCGPTPYMAGVRTLLAAAGFNMQHYHEESFNFEAAATAPQAEEKIDDAAQAASTDGFTIEFTKSGKKIICKPDQFVLNASANSGLRLPVACSKGVCGTCKTKLISGQVDMKHGGGIRQREIDQGMFLPCCSKPLGDLVVEK